MPRVKIILIYIIPIHFIVIHKDAEYYKFIKLAIKCYKYRKWAEQVCNLIEISQKLYVS